MASFDKNYFECYALTCLTKTLSDAYGDLCHGEAPDLQGRQLSIGVEVTRSVSADEAVGRIVQNDVNEQVDQLRHSVMRKLEKLNDGYKLFKSNRLYIFAETQLLNSQNIRETVRQTYAKRSDLTVKYDIVYVDCYDCLYVIKCDNFSVKKVPIPETVIKAIQKTAAKVKNGEW